MPVTPPPQTAVIVCATRRCTVPRRNKLTTPTKPPVRKGRENSLRGTANMARCCESQCIKQLVFRNLLSQAWELQPLCSKDPPEQLTPMPDATTEIVRVRLRVPPPHS